jgi:SAM-dependent methyltransferase
MNLLDLVNRPPVPAPWEEGDNIPWNDPAFSKRMLREHLSQAHDAASRRFEKIDLQVGWIHQHLLAGQPSRVLDLGCGPGLYMERLARLGHTCRGIDFSPASIAYASEVAQRENLSCSYLCQDLRQAEFGHGFGMAMLIFGEFNVFRPADGRSILVKAWQALEPGGWLLLEPHPFEMIRRMGEQPTSWYSTSGGLFSDDPHLVLEESIWDAEKSVAMFRYFVLEATSGAITRYAQSMQAYTDDRYRALLAECGFGNIRFYPSLGGDEETGQSDLIAIVGQKAH